MTAIEIGLCVLVVCFLGMTALWVQAHRGWLRALHGWDDANKVCRRLLDELKRKNDQ